MGIENHKDHKDHKNLIFSEKYINTNANGNRLSVQIYPSNQLKPKKWIVPDNVDSLIVLIPDKDEKDVYTFQIIECDGTESAFCGNGAMAALYAIQQDQPSVTEVTLITKEGEKVIVKEQEGNYEVNMGQVHSYEINEAKFEKIVSEGVDLEKEIDWTDGTGMLNKSGYRQEINDPELPHLFDIYPENTEHSWYASYFAQLFSWFDDEKTLEKFNEFTKQIEFKGLYSAKGEPHIILEMTKSEYFMGLTETERNIWMKLYTLMMRNYQIENKKLVFPQGVNFMFYVEDGEEIRMFPSERGVHNGLDFDQTGACGTGTTSLAKYLLDNNPQLNNLSITNRSGQELEVERFPLEDPCFEILLKGTVGPLKEVVKDSVPWHIQAMLERIKFYGERVFNKKN